MVAQGVPIADPTEPSGQDQRVRTLDGPAAVLAATKDHPYARFGVGVAAEVRGVTDGDAVLWRGRSPYGWIGHGLGDLSTVVDLVGGIDLMDGVRWINLPRHEPRPGFTRNEDWDLMWVTGPVPSRPGGERVVRLDEGAGPAINALLDEAFPNSGVRPDSGGVLGWYGIWADSTLVACAADRSTRAPDVAPVGFIGGVAVHPEHRRGGLGAAVTSELTRRLQRTHDLVALGVMADNLDAIRLYQRLGYAGWYGVTSVRPSTQDD
jgi:ribosomal protein S18 acetylase RimI-like enzyme